ncbi:uncharacterized protein LOC106875102 [Octopus bimaculoides]|uniref:Uncharacterized protein n=1 Tax=Octopus bimaculoides TaxID=37653 RepID=A0A0L8GRX8_OCTBM|nr:uncharacterized protein LOC106875102 [Octopus bimaculoides]|eukprot:XP_014778569.1 PREDICTED: uncharacterized protein LOC106875102 [Octopus bimaculoides]
MLFSPAGVTPSGAKVPEYHMPTNNYLSGDWKSHNWRGPAYYVPSERRWIAYHNYRTLPDLIKRDSMDIQCEDQYVDFVRTRDTPSCFRYRNIGILPSIHPHLMLNGYKRELLYSQTANKFHMAPMPCRRYYINYHDVLDEKLYRRHKDVSSIFKIGPCDVPNYGHIPNIVSGKTSFTEEIDRNNPMYENVFCTGTQYTHRIDKPYH